MISTTKFATCMWFEKGEARKAAEFYASLFPNTSVGKGHASPSDNPSAKAGEELTVEFTLLGHPVLGLNGGPMFRPTEAMSLMVMTEDQAETDKYWNAITANGGAESYCGWCKDRWGFSWQIVPRILMEVYEHPDKAATKRAFDAMMTMGKIDVEGIRRAIGG